MPLETITYISDLDPANPSGTDGVAQGDDHLRGIKSALKTTFPNVTGVVSGSHTELNAAVAATKGTGELVFKPGTVAAPGIAPLGDSDTGFSSPGANQLDISVGGSRVAHIAADRTVTFDGAITGPGSVPVGGTVIWWDDTLPSEGGWTWANGAAISRSANPILFARWGTRFGGGDNSTTFNVPDLRETVPIGQSGMGVSGTRALVDTGSPNNVVGEARHTLTEAELAAHSHGAASTVHDPSHVHTTVANVDVFVNGAGVSTALGSGARDTGPAFTGISVTTAIGGAGGNSPHNNIQPSSAVNYIIRVG